MSKNALYLLALLPLVHGLTFTLNPQDGKLFEVNERFLSVALDCSNIEGRFSDFNLTDPYLTKLVSHLAPMYFRIGGTYADRIVFSEETEGKVGASDLTFLSSDYLKVYQFTKNAGVRLIYDLNSLLRNDDGTWNSENAEAMIRFSSENQLELDWELGNEPDLYNALYSTHVDASELAKNFQSLRTILDQYQIYKSSKLIGIDMFDVGGSQANQDYLGTFLQGAADVVDAVTWHQYYFAGRDATEALFLTPSTFNYLAQRTNVVKNVVANSGRNNKIWMGETSSAYNGGAADMSNRFIGTFLWLDKLGLGATLGMDVIIRQTIFHDNYALIDNDYIPNPDWWVSVLYKKLIGTSVLSLANDGTADNTVRLYAHCAKTQGRNNVVVFGFNLANDAATVTVNGFQADNKVQVYELTAETDLYSQYVKLNGDVLKVSTEGELPELNAKTVDNNGSFTLAGYSIAFWVFENTDVTACSN